MSNSTLENQFRDACMALRRNEVRLHDLERELRDGTVTEQDMRDVIALGKPDMAVLRSLAECPLNKARFRRSQQATRDPGTR